MMFGLTCTSPDSCGGSLAQALRSSSAIGLVLACAGIAPAAAQETAPAPVALPPISVEGQGVDSYKPEVLQSPKFTEPLLNTPQVINVIPRAVIEERRATSLGDALRMVPGISMVAGEGGGAQGDQFRIRGFDAGNDIYIDGLRDSAQYFRDPFNYEQLEVIKGPGSIYSGRGSTGGAVNQATKRPRLDGFSAGDLAVGTNGTRRATADVNQPLTGLGLEGAALRLNVMAHHNEVAERDVVEQSRFGFAPSLSLGLGTPTRLTVSYLYQQENNIPDYGLPLVGGVLPAPLDRSNWYGFRNLNDEETTANVTTVELSHDLNAAVTLSNRFRYGYYTRDAIVSPPRSPDVVAGTVSRNPTGRNTNNTLLIDQADVTARFATGGLQHTFVAGVELSREEVEFARTSYSGSPLADLFNPDPDTPFTGTASRGTYNETTADGVALYAVDTLKLSEQWQVMAGLRWDHFSVDYSSLTAAGVREDLSRTDTPLSWRAGVVYKPAPNGSVYAAVGTSFNPAGEALALSSSDTSTSNVNLEPEETRSYEVGTKWDIVGGRMAVTAALFHIEKTNARSRNTADPTDVVTLDGEAVVNGFEVGVAGDITPAWKVYGGYTFLDSEITESKNPAELGNEMGRTPPHTLSLWSTYQLQPRWQVGAGVQYVSHMTVSNTNTTKLPDYWLFDATVAYQLTDKINIRLNGYNLTDEFYFDRVHGGGSHGVPGAGRTFLLSTSLTF